MKNTMKNFIKEHGLQDYIKPTSKWWYAYYETVNANYNITLERGFHCHHIIPRCLFRGGALKDNGMMDSPYNIVNVPIHTHMVLHYMLYKAAKPGWFKDAMEWAYRELEKTERQVSPKKITRIVIRG